ncbi:MAG: hypothetical protein IJB45_04730 [Clostridia bacterium]|nr:hypothetical protein [Clostridia bacterium]
MVEYFSAVKDKCLTAIYRFMVKLYIVKTHIATLELSKMLLYNYFRIIQR